MRGIIESIRKHGQLMPALVSRNSSGFEMLAGHRRQAALVELGETTMECIVLETADSVALMIRGDADTRPWTGVDHLACWAHLQSASDRSTLLKAIRSNTRNQILELAKVLGEKRLIELVKIKPFGPSMVLKAKILRVRYAEFCSTITAPTVREIVEWVLKFKGNQALHVLSQTGRSRELQRLAVRIRRGQPFPQSDW